jgi:TPR repeat protein
MYTPLYIINNECKNNILKYIYNNELDTNMYNNLGLYYQYIEKDYNKMMKYYLKGFKLNDSNAILNLGDYYNSIKNYKKMKKYYLKAIELGNSYAMISLGYYYNEIINYNEMKKYYEMAIELGNSNAMNNLGYYYYEIENYDEMKKYYLKAIELDNSMTMYNLGLYYQNIKDNENMRKYYIMALLNDFNDNRIPYNIVIDAIINHNYIYNGNNNKLKNIYDLNILYKYNNICSSCFEYNKILDNICLKCYIKK